MTLTASLTIRGLTFPNRMVVSPMCQYSLRDGLMGDWHLVHLGRFALGGFGAVVVEATGVTAEGRITYGCPGLWSDAHIPGLARVTDFLRGQGVVSGIQLAHAGRKAATLPPWRIGEGAEPDGEIWQPVAPSALAHGPDSVVPRALTADEVEALPQVFADAAGRALQAGFDFVELHGAHGYLLNQFLSPVANHRTDEWGGSPENRMRLPLQVIAAVRAVWPQDRPLFLRLSAVDGVEGGVTLEDSIVFCQKAAALGVDVFDVSATGFAGSKVAPGPGMFLPFATAIRQATGKPVMAVGMMDDVALASDAVVTEKADLVAIGRGALDDPNWASHAALASGTPPRQAWTKQVGYALERRPVRSAT
jgi:2,4-dienoyl-CoA reductase-like NADH-dependent reductase (Old Yellow Enzyme family)